MMTLTKSYSVVTEHGDIVETTIESQHQHATVRDVVKALRECLPSCSPLCETGHNCWATTMPDEDIYETEGVWATYTYHVEGVTPHQRRRLFRLAGLVK